MDAGRLDQRISIETRQVTINALGEETTAWAVAASPWARVIETQGREFLKGDIQAETKAVFEIRFREVDSTARVTWRGRVFQIDDVTGTRREGFTWLHCRSVAGAN